MPIEIGKEKIFSPGEAAKRMGMSPNTITKWLRSGQLRGIQRGRRWYVPESAILEYIGVSDIQESHGDE